MKINWLEIGNVFDVKVTPRSSFNKIKFDDRSKIIRVYVTAPPEDGKANEAVIRLLSDEMHLPKSQISILRGHSSRTKTIRIDK